MSSTRLLPNLPDLPVKETLPRLLDALDTHTRVVLEAPPGAGKTTLVPLALLEASWRNEGKILVLEPRRLATRAAAQRMSDLLDEDLGQTVGYWIRMEHMVSSKTRIEVVTEGILTRLIQDDPALEGIAAIIFDEFHERSLQADLGLALALDAQAVLRPDLRLLVMSATLDAAAVGNWLEAPVVRSEGRQFPVETHYLPNAAVAAAGNRPTERLVNLVPKAVREALEKEEEGDILVFLPGMGEIRRVAQQLEGKLGPYVDLHLLHGELALSKQLAAIAPALAGRRKVVLTTSIAETSLTIEGVKIVIDGGFARVPRFVPRTGLTTLETLPVSQAAADQRRGRAGRLGPGICYRLWSSADQLQLSDRQAPEICEADLTGLVLELAIWGVKDATTLKWLDTPPPAALALGRDLLQGLEAIDAAGNPTRHGKALATLGLSPRLGHLVVRGSELGQGATACALAALLSERDILKPVQVSRPSPLPDLHLRLELLSGIRPPTPGFVVDENTLRRVREQAQHLRQRIREPEKSIHPDATGLLTALAYPDRMAQRESSGKVRLVTGQRAGLQTELFGEAAFYGVAHLEIGKYPRVLLAAPVTKAELLEHFIEHIEQVQEVRWDAAAARVVARQFTRLGALVVEETALAKPDPELVAEALLQALQEKGVERLPWSDSALRTRQRLAFLHQFSPEDWPELSDQELANTMDLWLGPHLAGMRSMEQVSRLDFNEILLSSLSWEQRQEMDRLAPTHLEVPSGSRIALDYSDPATPVLAVRLQEVFGMLDTPRIGGGKVALLIHLLSPASRPVQVTQDLRSFWNNGYFEVRKDLRGRYPKHHWPEDPLSAQPTRGTKKRPQ
ncbi:ATP-dependent helicase HrpB [Pontibacter ummariensis]|uniref:ATP-dependent helicase HrpB n=1 Tax=Pontibacter ummariensis TaxID=1610492 RepID=A0A239I4W8_9BACT|nr:ATP-dependent helicase HrpB [Pontibacter ummariensis]PRY10223.1 ATP-dependent helicase HrpB [Pontibacter ummariensis]SNS88412.1 ATP-dependent helicase HrpB [Pontibacter ummariensis]